MDAAVLDSVLAEMPLVGLVRSVIAHPTGSWMLAGAQPDRYL
jgi:hypothetical protein